jgi:hypothetical protein
MAAVAGVCETDEVSVYLWEVPHARIRLQDAGSGGRVATVSFRAPTIGAGENRWIVNREKEGLLRIKGSKQQAPSSCYIDPNTLRKPGYIDPSIL